MASKNSRAQRRSPSPDEQSARKYVSQADVPAFSLDQALRVARALSDTLGKGPAKPLRVAQAMNIAPGSSQFRMLCGASIAYGLTDGGYNSEQVALTTLGRRIVAPTQEGDDVAAMREATLRPRVLRDFLTRYNGSKLPPENIAHNILEEMEVPATRAAAVYALIVESARTVGFLQEVKGATYVDLDSSEAPIGDAASAAEPTPSNDGEPPAPAIATQGGAATPAASPHGATHAVKTKNRVFITHGKNKDIVSQLKELLTFGGFTPIVAIENETVSKPVPDKVLDDMRSCAAAVIHVGAEVRMMDPDGKEHRMLNQNVLIEIGAALALYGRKFILLVEKGASLPSNLQGLYEVRYDGGKLDYESTMRLLKAFNDFRG